MSLTLVATQITAGARELRGALHRLQAMSTTYGEPITRELAERGLAELARHNTRAVRLADVQKVVCDVFGVEPGQLKSDRKGRSLAEPRMLAMWLARKYTRAPWSEIGEFFGRNSHSTVISAHRRVEKLIAAAGARLGWPISLARSMKRFAGWRRRCGRREANRAVDRSSQRKQGHCSVDDVPCLRRGLKRVLMLPVAWLADCVNQCCGIRPRAMIASCEAPNVSSHMAVLLVRCAVGVQADAELVDAEARPGGDDVAGDGEHRQAAALHQSAPAGVEHERVPEHDHQRAVFLRVPAPEAAPGVVGPQAAEHRADEAEEDREAERAVDHAQHLLAGVLVEQREDVGQNMM